MKLHKRTLPVQTAEVELHGMVNDWQQRHGLTDLEALGCIHAVAQRITKYALRAERHPDNPDEPADKE